MHSRCMSLQLHPSQQMQRASSSVLLLIVRLSGSSIVVFEVLKCSAATVLVWTMEIGICAVVEQKYQSIASE